jgi:hypothetical protein
MGPVDDPADLAGLLLLEFAVLRHWKEHGRLAGFGMVPQPELSRHPAWRKTFLWLVSLTGAAISLGSWGPRSLEAPGMHTAQQAGSWAAWA